MNEVFGITKPLWEIGVRATIVYLALVLLLRAVPKRNAGHLSPNDLITVIVVGGVATDAIMGGSTSVGDNLLLIAAVVAWAYVLNLLEFRFPAFRRLLRDRQTILIRDGRMIRPNMRREMVTEEELLAALREDGIDDPGKVRFACLEADGEISIVKR